MNAMMMTSVRFRLLSLLLLSFAIPLRAQTAEDGIMLTRQRFCTGFFFTYDSWDNYWEGTRQRTNGNLGTVITRTVLYTGNYGLTDRINLIDTVPYVYTHATGGVLHGQSGLQDFSLAAKVKVLSVPIRNFGAVRLIGVVQGSVPMTNYTPDLQPLSLGLHTRQLEGRAIVNLLGKRGLYVNATAAYNLRGNVTLDRSSYYTNGQLYLSNQVAMPNQFLYSVSAGYRKNDMTVTGSYSEQQTRGGGDIRIQDNPFVSNRFNYQKAGFTITYPIPHLRNLGYWLIYNNTFNGRNVGQSSTYTTGFLYTFDFERRTHKK